MFQNTPNGVVVNKGMQAYGYDDSHAFDEEGVLLAPKWALRNFARILQEFHENFIKTACIRDNL
jgi:hypothetical protein